MKKKLILITAFYFVFSCASQKTIEEDDFATDSSGDEIAVVDDLELSEDSALTDNTDSSSDTVADSSSQVESTNSSNESNTEVDEFENFENEANSNVAQKSEEEKLEQELNSVNSSSEVVAEKQAEAEPQDELSLDEPLQDQTKVDEIAANQEQAQSVEETFPENILDENQQQVATNTPPPEVISESPVLEPTPIANLEAPPVEDFPVEQEVKPVDITALNYKANDNGGTVVVEATGPIEYDVRKNESLNQFIVEIKNSNLPQRLARPLNTKEMVGSIGSIDAYQNNDSSLTRLVIQMREGSPDPVVQLEGNRLLVVGDGPGFIANQGGTVNADGSVAPSTNVTLNADGTPITTAEEEIPLPAQTFEEFLTLTPNFVGKKISLEMDAPVTEVIKFISAESGANLIIDDQVNSLAGNISFKLKDVPWDQALVTVLKLKNLVYIRQGNVLRITTQDRLEAAQKIIDDLKQKKIKEEKLIVKYFPLSYVKPSEVKANIENFKSKEGKVLTDDKTNSLIITDTKDVVDQLEKIVKILDVAPSQVLIEGKVVEATENFTRGLGVRWNLGNAPIDTGSVNSQGSAITLTPALTVGGVDRGDSSLLLNFGTLDNLGDISATLSLGELENKAKVISSPRVVTTNNEAARITQNNQIPITTSTPGAGGIPITTVNYTDVPLALSVTPAVTNNGFVKMKINVERSFPTVAEGSNPGINRRSADTNVIVKDGQTAVIGGIFSEDEANSVSGVPFLKDIPILGGIFRGQSKTKVKSELLIFVTPKVLNLEESTRSEDFIIE